MFFDLPQDLFLMTGGAFLLGWLLSSITRAIGSRNSSSKRDPRDDRIRSLEADLRVARTDSDSLKETSVLLTKTLDEAKEGIEKRDNAISHQQDQLENMSTDLKDSVLKTRELRSELSDRVTESLKSEVKLREVETELEVAQASTDMIATGVLEYPLELVGEEGENDDDDLLDESDMTNATT